MIRFVFQRQNCEVEDKFCFKSAMFISYDFIKEFSQQIENLIN